MRIAEEVAGQTCTSCGQYKPLTAFYKRSINSRNGRTRQCSECLRAYHKKWHEKNRPKENSRRALHALNNRENALAAYRKHQLKKKYGLTFEEYTRRLQSQGGVCAICRQAETTHDHRGKLRELAVDHDHSTGAVRGLLCGKCNKMIGLGNDDINILYAAIAYLRTSRGEKVA